MQSLNGVSHWVLAGFRIILSPPQVCSATYTSGWSLVSLILLLPLGHFSLVQQQMVLIFLTDPSWLRLQTVVLPLGKSSPMLKCTFESMQVFHCRLWCQPSSSFLNTAQLCLQFSSLLFRDILHDTSFAVTECIYSGRVVKVPIQQGYLVKWHLMAASFLHKSSEYY